VVDFLNYLKTYGVHKVLSIPELTIPAGIHWIKGMNGSGKSTLLKSMAGIIPFEGEIKINGYNLKRDPILSRRLVGYCEAEPVYPVFLTASDIIGFVVYVRDLNWVEVEKIVHYFGVETFQDQATGGYSTGMLKKLALCIAFLGKISWVLLDEPFAFIDKETEEKLITLINLKRRKGVNFIITSHHELNQNTIAFDGIYSISNAQLHKIQ
jgi:ABC-2 type transport system ATP-binding protein